MGDLNGAPKRDGGPVAWYAAFMRWVCLAIGLALVLRHAAESRYEGAIALAGVMAAYFAGALFALRPRNPEPQTPTQGRRP